MPHPLDGIRAKIARAKEHIKQINDDITVNRKVRFPSDPVRANLQVEIGRLSDPSTHHRRIVFYLKGVPPAIDVSLTILAGEAVHHLRSVLDHLVYQLIIAKTKQPPTFNSAFPIVGNGRKKKKVWISAAEEYAAQTSRLKRDISISAEALIHSLQPFQRGATFHDDPLWTLAELDNAYKHRLLLLTIHRVTNYWVTVKSRDKVITTAFHPHPGIRFEHGAEIGWIEITDPDFSIADADVTVDGDLGFDIAFNEPIDPRGGSVLDCLGDLARAVSQTVDGFIPEFS